MKNVCVLLTLLFCVGILFVACKSATPKTTAPITTKVPFCEVRKNTKLANGAMVTECLEKTVKDKPCLQWRTEMYNNGNSITRCIEY